MNTRRLRLSATLLATIAVLIACGGGNALTTYTFSKWVYRASLPLPDWSYGATTVGLDGRIYLFGGATTNNSTDQSAFVYTPSTDSWAPIANLPTGRTIFGAATAPNGLIYTFGGSGYQGDDLTVVEAYDPTTNTWTCSVGDTVPGCSTSTLAPVPTSRDWFTVLAGHDGRR